MAQALLPVLDVEENIPVRTRRQNMRSEHKHSAIFGPKLLLKTGIEPTRARLPLRRESFWGKTP